MALFINFQDALSTLKTEIDDKELLNILIRYANDFIKVNKAIYYYDESKNLFVGSDLKNYIVKRAKREDLGYIPSFKFKPTEISFTERFIRS